MWSVNAFTNEAWTSIIQDCTKNGGQKCDANNKSTLAVKNSSLAPKPLNLALTAEFQVLAKKQPKNLTIKPSATIKSKV
jgi:hypothetical protein